MTIGTPKHIAYERARLGGRLEHAEVLKKVLGHVLQNALKQGIPGRLVTRTLDEEVHRVLDRVPTNRAASSGLLLLLLLVMAMAMAIVVTIVIILMPTVGQEGVQRQGVCH